MVKPFKKEKKMKKRINTAIVILAVIMVVCIALAACQESVKIYITVSKTELRLGESVTIGVVATNGGECELSIDRTDIASFDDNVLTVTQAVNADTDITVTAKLKDKPSITATKIITVKKDVNPIHISTEMGTEFDIDNPLPVGITVDGGESCNVTFKPYGTAYYVDGWVYAFNDVDNDTQVEMTVTLQNNTSISANKVLTLKPAVQRPTVRMSLSKDKIATGDADVFVTVMTTGGAPYTLTVTNTDLIQVIDNTKLHLLTTNEYDSRVTVRATLNDDPTVYAERVLTVKAPRKAGVVSGKDTSLTTAMLNDLSGNNLTITGTVVDHEINVNKGTNKSTTFYSIVYMSEDSWKGISYKQGNESNEKVSYFVKGKEVQVNNGIMHLLYSQYIDKNNQIVTNGLLKDSDSIPYLWEELHYWNHLDDYITTDNVQYDDADDLYYLEVRNTPNNPQTALDFAYFQAYTAQSYTAVLDPNSIVVRDIALKVENVGGEDVITGMIIRTEDSVSSDGTVTYSMVELTFSDVGTTEISDIASYQSDANTQRLQQAIDKMKQAANYTFIAKQVQTYSPEVDDEAGLQSDSIAVASALNASTARSSSVYNHYITTAHYEGLDGKITATDVLLERSTKVSGMDGDEYAIEYTGYHGNSDNTYDIFEYSYALSKLQGKRKVSAPISTAIPQFDVAAEIFTYVGKGNKTDDGADTYVYALRDASIIKSVAMQMSMHSYAANADEYSFTNRFTVIIDANGNFVSIAYPYELITEQAGYITTEFYRFGTTTIPVDFTSAAEYAPRVSPTSWADFTVEHYSDLSTSLSDKVTSSGLEVFALLLREDGKDRYEGADLASKLPSVTALGAIFDDYIISPRYDMNGSTQREYIQVNVYTNRIDENNKLLNDAFLELSAELNEVFEAAGFVKQAANSTKVEELSELDRNNMYISYYSDAIKCQAVVESNRSGWIRIYFYKGSPWTL